MTKQEGAFSLCFKSVHFPGECVATRRGSPLLVGIKSKSRLATDHIPVLYSKGKPKPFFLFLKKKKNRVSTVRFYLAPDRKKEKTPNYF
jgi:glucosamine 6-phosphate synthetase-like amidotransferase/phosphosugar isomerase protein